MKTGRNYRLYPTDEQKRRFDRVFKATVFVWNWYLGWRYLGLFISTIRKLMAADDVTDFSSKITELFKVEILRSVNKKLWAKIEDQSLAKIVSILPERISSSKVRAIVDCWLTCDGNLTLDNVNRWHKTFCNDMQIPVDKGLSDGDIKKKLTVLKNDSCVWLNDFPAQALFGQCRTANETFQRWFKSLCKAPRFKQRDSYRASFSIQQNKPKPNKDGTVTYQNRVEGDGKVVFLTIPKFPKTKMVLHRTLGGHIGTVTISRTATGEYYVSFPVEIDHVPEERVINEKTAIGIDVGLSSFITDDRGNKIDPGKFRDEKLEAKRKYLQRKLEKKRDRSPGWKTSKRYHRERIRLSRIEEKIARKRSDYLHKLSHTLTNDEEVGLIGLENLGIKGMLKNRRLARAISNAGWYEYKRQLEYKAAWKGAAVQSVEQRFPSSKLCSVCGYKNRELTLADREWVCPNCKTHHDRDQNAAQNIKKRALELYQKK